MTTYTVYFASRSILYAEAQIEAETPEQALERAMEMAEDEGGTLLDRLGGQYHDDPYVQYESTTKAVGPGKKDRLSLGQMTRCY
jgi:hypothetical protein